MVFVLLSVACSVLVSVWLKLAARRGLDAGQMVTWNYLVATALCAAVLAPPLDALRRPDTPWPALLLLGAVLPGGFLVLAASVKSAGIVRTGLRSDGRSFGGGLLLGLLNFGNIVFYVRAHQALPDSPATVIAGGNIGVVLLGTLAGTWLFGEKLGRPARVAIPLALAAIGMIAWASAH